MATRVSSDAPAFQHVARRCFERASDTCIGRARPHRRDAHRGRCRFSGQTRDGRYSWARYYHPGLQRFISEDPIGFAGGDPNLYAYVGNSPTGLIDPLGLDAWSDAGNLAAGFGDTLTLGGTAWVRGLWTQQFGLPDTVDASSGWNLAGRKTAHAWDAAMGILSGAAALRAAPSLVPLLTNEIGAVGRVVVNTTAKPRTVARALRLAERFVGEGYREIGRAGSGVFRSADGLRQFRMTAWDIVGAHGKIGPHVHFEYLNQLGRVIRNVHVPLIGY